MPTLDVSLPAGIGETIQMLAGAHAGQVAMVIAWRITHPRVVVGGVFDGAPSAAFQVKPAQGNALWLAEADVLGLGAPVLITIFLPLTGGDAVLVRPSRARGVVRGWEASNDGYGTRVTYRVQMDGAPPGEAREVEEVFLDPHPD